MTKKLPGWMSLIGVILGGATIAYAFWQLGWTSQVAGHSLMIASLWCVFIAAAISMKGYPYLGEQVLVVGWGPWFATVFLFCNSWITVADGMPLLAPVLAVFFVGMFAWIYAIGSEKELFERQDRMAG